MEAEKKAETTVEKVKEKRTKRLPVAILVPLFFVITLILFGPCELLGSNSNDFGFSIFDMWYYNAILAGIVWVVGVIVLMILPRILYEICSIACFAFTLCSYVQAMFLNGKMESLLGQKIVFDTSTIAINLAIWVVIVAAVVVIRLKVKVWKEVIAIAAGIITAMQLVAMVSLFMPDDSKAEVLTDDMLTNEYQFDLSKNDNAVVFILDTFYSGLMDNILEEDPTYLDNLDGFTYFPDCTSAYSRTYPSVAHVMTGYDCHFDMPYREWVNEAYENSTFIDQMAEKNVNVGIYTFRQYLGDCEVGKISNYYNGMGPLIPKNVVKQTVKMCLYRDMPYLVKPLFEYDATKIESIVYEVDDSIPEQNHAFDDGWYHEQMDAKVLNTGLEDQNSFKIYHLMAFHDGFEKESAMNAFAVVEKYIAQMKELGVYDNATIIIMADHGISGGGENEDEWPGYYLSPLMLVKEKGSSGTPVKISKAPVTQEEVRAQVLEGLSIECEDPTFFEISETENRERIYNLSGLHTDLEGEIRLVEYKVTGDARDEKNYHPTGEEWPIQYSENTVKNGK